MEAEYSRAERFCIDEFSGVFSHPEDCVAEEKFRIDADYQKLRKQFEIEYGEFIGSFADKSFLRSGEHSTHSPVHQKYRKIVKERLFARNGLNPRDASDQKSLLDELYDVAQICVDKSVSMASVGDCIFCEESIKQAAGLTTGMILSSREELGFRCSFTGTFTQVLTCPVKHKLVGEYSAANRECHNKSASSRQCDTYLEAVQNINGLENFDKDGKCKSFFALFGKSSKKSLLRRINRVNKPVLQVITYRHH